MFVCSDEAVAHIRVLYAYFVDYTCGSWYLTLVAWRY